MTTAGKVSNDFFKRTDISLKEYIQNNDLATLSAENFYATQIENTRGIKGVKQVLADFNSIQDESGKTQQAYSNAIKQSNANLGNYLTNLNGAKANLPGYAKHLVGAKVATIGLQAATVALNAALSMGVAALASWGIQQIIDFINREEIAKEKLDNLLSESKETTKNNLEEVKSLQDNLSLYDELSKKTSLTAEEKEKLVSVQQDLIDKYGVEVKGVDLLNGKYKENNALLKEIISNKAKAAVTSSKTEYETAKSKEHNLENGIEIYG